MIRTYRELSSFESFDDRFDYLYLSGKVGADTFGFDRWMNQRFYRSSEWRSVRNQVIVRDNGCDLGVDGFDIHGGVFIHHMNPITSDDITMGVDDILNPEYLISTTQKTHNAIHYGGRSGLPRVFKVRTPGDTRLW
jgi:hypothetical protein